MPGHVAGRHELTFAEWTRIAPILPCTRDGRNALRGSSVRPQRQAMGCAWPNATARGPLSPRVSAAGRREGLWDRKPAVPQGELAEAGRIDWELWCIDGSHVWAHRVAAGGREKTGDHALGR